MDSDKISINLQEKPELAAALAGASPGDTLTITLKVMIDELGVDEILVGSIESCSDYTVKSGPDKHKGGTGEASEEATAPVLSVMAPTYKRSKY